MNEKTEDAPARIREKLVAVSTNVQAAAGDAQAAARVQQENSAAIRRLTVAVWMLSAIIVVDVALNAIIALPLFFSGEQLIPYSGGMEPSSFSAPMAFTEKNGRRDLAEMRRESEKFNDFSDWPPEKQVQEASVILIAKYQKDGAKMKAIVSEIVKQNPNAKSYYKIGDEYAHGSRYTEEGLQYGDGQVIFFTGSPAMMRMSMSFHGDRIGGLGDMPLDLLREMAKQPPATAPAK